jgi:hypothetical protein
MRTFTPHWVFPMLALIVAACQEPPQPDQANSEPLADTTISAQQPGTPPTSPANAMSVVIGPSGLRPR